MARFRRPIILEQHLHVLCQLKNVVTRQVTVSSCLEFKLRLDVVGGCPSRRQKFSHRSSEGKLGGGLPAARRR
jgi:hypothetical protein